MEIITALSQHGHGFLEDAGREGTRCSCILHICMCLHSFFQPFQHPKVSLRIPFGCHADFTFPSSTDAGRAAWHENWELAVNLIKKWCLLFDSVFDLMMNRCVFNQIFWLWKCKRVDYDISSFCHIPIKKISQFIRSEAPNHIDLQHWWCGFAFKRAYRIWGHSGFHVNMCGNGCCKYMNQILILLLKYDIEKDGE